jgi:hypothetical protein
VSKKRAGFIDSRPQLSTASFRRPREIGGQMELW